MNNTSKLNDWFNKKYPEIFNNRCWQKQKIVATNAWNKAIDEVLQQLYAKYGFAIKDIIDTEIITNLFVNENNE